MTNIKQQIISLLLCTGMSALAMEGTLFSPKIVTVVSNNGTESHSIDSRVEKILETDNLFYFLAQQQQKKGREPRILKKHTKPITCMALKESQNMLATGSEDGTVCLWNLVTGECKRQLTNLNYNRIDPCYNSLRDYIVSSSSISENKASSCEACSDIPRYIAFNPVENECLILTGNVISLWDTKTGTCLFPEFDIEYSSHYDKINPDTLVFEPSGKSFLVIGSGKVLSYFSKKNGIYVNNMALPFFVKYADCMFEEVTGETFCKKEEGSRFAYYDTYYKLASYARLGEKPIKEGKNAQKKLSSSHLFPSTLKIWSVTGKLELTQLDHRDKMIRCAQLFDQESACAVAADNVIYLWTLISSRLKKEWAKNLTYEKAYELSEAYNEFKEKHLKKITLEEHEESLQNLNKKGEVILKRIMQWDAFNALHKDLTSFVSELPSDLIPLIEKYMNFHEKESELESTSSCSK